MSLQTINIGQYANDGSGDDLRSAFTKVNANFALLGGDIPVAEATNLGTNSVTVTAYSNKIGTGPFLVQFAITPQLAAPATGVYYYVSGNSNPLYNGHFTCTASALNSITLSYPTDPGVYVGTATTTISTAIGIFKDKNVNVLEFNGIKSSDNSVSITPGTGYIDIKAASGVKNDTNPSLGGTLDMAGNNIINTGVTGDIEATVYGIRIDILNSLFALFLQSNTVSIDMGVIISNYANFNLDMGLVLYPVNNSLDFGTLG